MSSTITHTGVGQVSNTNGLGYSFSFATLNREDIQVEVIDPSNVISTKTVTTDYTIENYLEAGSSNSHIKFVSSDARGFTDSQTTYKVRISRQTPSTPKVNFTAGSSITASDLNTQGKQAFHLSEENRDSINALALGDSSSAIQIDSSNIKDLTIKAIDIEEKAVETDKINDLAVTTGKIADLAVTDAKIASTGIAGTKISPDFGSQTIRTTGSLDIPNRIQTTTNPSGTIFGGTDFGFNTTPGGTTIASKDNIVFIAIGDSDTGILQDTDGELEIWSNDQEIANFNAANGITLKKAISSNSNIATSGAIAATGNITANSPGKFVGDGSSLTNIQGSALPNPLPAIDGSALTGIPVPLVKQIKEVTATAQQEVQSSVAFNDALTMTLNNTSSTSRVLVLSTFRIHTSTPYQSSRYARAKTTIGEDGTFAGNKQGQAINNSGSNSGSANSFNIFLDENSTSGTREYRIRFKKDTTGSAFIANCRLIAIEFEVS